MSKKSESEEYIALLEAAVVFYAGGSGVAPANLYPDRLVELYKSIHSYLDDLDV